MKWVTGTARVPCALVDRFFAGDLARDGWERLLRHLDTCEACRARFETTRRALRALGGAPLGDGGGGLALGRIEGELIGGVLLPRAPRRRARRLAPALLAGALAAAAVAAAVVVVVAGRRGPAVPEMSERGAATAPRPGFDVLCLPAGDATGVVSARHAGGRCAHESYLKVTVTVPTRAWRHATVLAVDDAWRLRFSARAEISGQAAQILPGHARLARADHLYFKAFFSNRSIDDESVPRAIAEARAAGLPPAARLALAGEQSTYEVQTDE